MANQETIEDLVERVRAKRKLDLDRKRAASASGGYAPNADQIDAAVKGLFEEFPATGGEIAKHTISSLLSGTTEGLGSMLKGPAVQSAAQLNFVARNLGLPEMPASMHPAHMLGSLIGSAGEAMVGPVEAVRREGGATKFFAEDVPSGLGSIASILIPGGIVGKVAGAAEMGPAAASRLAAMTTGVLGGEMQVGAVYDDLIAKGRSEEEASTAALLNFGVGATEAIPLGRMMGRLVRGSWGHYVKDALVEGTEEAAQSLFQQGAQNFIEKEITDQDIDLMTGVLESGKAGGASALIASLLVSAITGQPGVQRGGRLRPVKPGTLGPEPFPLGRPGPPTADRKVVDPRNLSTAERDLVQAVAPGIDVVEPSTPLEHGMAALAQRNGAKLVLGRAPEGWTGKTPGAYDKENRVALVMVNQKGDSKTWETFLHEVAGHDFVTAMRDVAPDDLREFMTEVTTTHREELDSHIRDYYGDEAAAIGLPGPRFTGVEGAPADAIEEGIAHLVEHSPAYMHMAFSSPQNVRRLLEGRSRTVFHAMFDSVIRGLRATFGVELSTSYEKELQNLEEANAAISGYEALDPQARLALADRIVSGMDFFRTGEAVPTKPQAPEAQAETGAPAPVPGVSEVPGGDGPAEAEVLPKDKPVTLDQISDPDSVLTEEKPQQYDPPEPEEAVEAEVDKGPKEAEKALKITVGPAPKGENAAGEPGGALRGEVEETKRKVATIRVGGKTFRPVFASKVDEALYSLTFGRKPKDAEAIRQWLDDQGIKSQREFDIRAGDVLAMVREVASEQDKSGAPAGEIQIPPTGEVGVKPEGMSEDTADGIKILGSWYNQVRNLMARSEDPIITGLIDRAYQNTLEDLNAGRIAAEDVTEFADSELKILAESQHRGVETETLDLGEQVLELIEEGDEAVDPHSRMQKGGFRIIRISDAKHLKGYSLSYAPKQDNPRFVSDQQFIVGDTVRFTESLYDRKTKAKVGQQTILGVISRALVSDGPITYSIKVMESDAEDAPIGSTISRSSRALRLSMAERAAVKDEIARKRFADSMRPQFSYEAYHGSGVRGIDRFDTAFVGTGQGAAMFGWGLYFTDKPAVAEHYRREMTSTDPRDGWGIDWDVANPQTYEKLYATARMAIKKRPEHAEYYTKRIKQVDELAQMAFGARRRGDEPNPGTGQILMELVSDAQEVADTAFVKHHGDARAAVSWLRHHAPGSYHGAPGREFASELAADWIEKGVVKPYRDPRVGATYKVELAPTEDELIQWDKPIKDQKPDVRSKLYDAALDAGLPASMLRRDTKEGMYGGTLYQAIGRALRPDAPSKSEQMMASSTFLAQRGIRGIKYTDQGSRGLTDESKKTYNYVIFSGDDVKIKAQFSYQKRETGEKPGFGERVDEALFDEMRVWRDLVKKYGPEAHQNPSLRETQYHGRGGERLAQLKKTLDGLLKSAAKRGIDVYDSVPGTPSLGDAVLGRHAPEANLYITDTKDPGGKIYNFAGSGMTNTRAQQVMREIAASPHKDFYEHVFAEVDKTTKKGLERLVKAGILTPKTVRDWLHKFPNYVPLLTIFDPDHSLPRPGTGFQPSAEVTKARKGRKTLPHNPFVSVFQKANQRVVMSEKNRIMKSAGEFVRRFEDKARWQVHSKRDTLSFEAVQENRVVRFFEDGHERWIEFANSRHAAALLRMNVMYGSEWLKKLSVISRAYMSMYTRWSPFFPFTNFPRDMAQAGLTGVVEQPKDFLKNIRKHTLSSFKTAWKLARDPELKGAQYDEIREWMNLGGRTGYIFTEGWVDFAKQVDKDVSRYAAKGPGAGAARAWRNFISVVEDMNDVAESVTRYAAYRAALDAGMTKDQAVVVSKEITVNFNRQGRWGPAIKAAYFFGNPSLQGLKRYAQTLTSKRGMAVSGGMLGAGFVMSMMNRALADDDEDGENSWQSRSSWEKARHLRFQIPGTTTAIGPPLPWGFNIPYYLGVQLEHMMSGHEEPGVAMANLFGEALDSMNPIGGSNLVQAAFPSILRPAIELSQNQDTFGRPIYPPESPWDTEAMPDHERHFQSVMPGWKVMAKAMSDVTGGDSVNPGLVEISPESLEHLGSFFAGGLGKGMLNIVTDLNDLMEGRPVRVRKVPVLSSYLSESYEGGPQMRFHAGVREVEKAAAVKARAFKQGDPEDVKEFLESEEAEVAGLSKQVARAKILYKQAREARDAAKTPAQRKLAEERMHTIERSLRKSLQAVDAE